MTNEKGVTSWAFGPYLSGRYSIITYGENGSKVTLPRSGFRRRDMANPLVFRIRYDAPEGWIAYSEIFQFDGRSLNPLKSNGKVGL